MPRGATPCPFQIAWRFGRTPDREVAQLAALLAELTDRLVGDVEGNLCDRASFGRDPVLGHDRVEFGLVTDFIALGFARPHSLQGEGQIRGRDPSVRPSRRGNRARPSCTRRSFPPVAPQMPTCPSLVRQHGPI